MHRPAPERVPGRSPVTLRARPRRLQTVGEATYIVDASLELAPGSMHVLLGPTLSGKTTLMRLMAGLDRPTSGRLVEDGRDVTGVGVKSRSVAMVYQQFVNYPTLSVYENIASPLRVQGLGQGRDRGPRGARRQADAARTHAQAHAGPAVGRPAAAHRPRPRPRQAGEARAARRAARQPRLQAARGTARGAAAHLRRDRRHPGLCHDRADRGAAAARPHRHACARAASPRSGPTAGLYREPDNLDAARVFSDPPLNELAVTVAGGAATLADGTRLPAAGPLAGLPDGAFTLAFRADAATVAGPARRGASRLAASRARCR